MITGPGGLHLSKNLRPRGPVVNVHADARVVNADGRERG